MTSLTAAAREAVDLELADGSLAPLVLEPEDVHIWFEHLDVEPEQLGALRATLAADELERASRFRFARDRHRFVAGRGMLRSLLARYTGQSPKSVRFAYGAYGKPRLVGGGITFNVSHSDDRVAFAFGRVEEIGIDIEALAPRNTDRVVAEMFFSPLEVRTLLALPAEERGAAFLTCWTRKEAFIKAKGNGLSLSLQDFDVTLAPGDDPALLRTAWSDAEPETWSLQDLSHRCPGYAAALAVRSRTVSVSVRDR